MLGPGCSCSMPDSIDAPAPRTSGGLAAGRAPLASSAASDPGRFLLLALLVVTGLGVRLAVMEASRGSNDVELWETFARAISRHGLIRAYQDLEVFNHPPLAGLLVTAAYDLARELGLRFSVALKALPLLGDVLTGFLLFGVWQRRRGLGLAALAIFALSPLSVLITGYHGNTDSLCAALVLLGVVQLEGRHFLRGGLALGAAINVKLIPVLLVPLFAARCTRWAELRALLGGLALCALPFAPVLVLAGAAFAEHALAYASRPNFWGVYGLLAWAAEDEGLAPYAAPAAGATWAVGRTALAAAVLAVAVLARRAPRASPYDAAFVTLGLLLVLGPGFAVQYTIYALPLLLATDLTRGLLYSLGAGLFALLCYHGLWTGDAPWFSRFVGRFPTPAVVVGLFVWAQLVEAVVAATRRGAAAR